MSRFVLITVTEAAGSENRETLSGMNVIQQESGVNSEKSEWVSLASVQDADSPHVLVYTHPPTPSALRN